MEQYSTGTGCDDGNDQTDHGIRGVRLAVIQAAHLKVIDKAADVGHGVQSAGGHGANAVNDVGRQAEPQEVILHVFQSDGKAAGGGTGEAATFTAIISLKMAGPGILVREPRIS